MKKFILSFLILSSSLSSFALTQKDENIFSAMQDEMDRTINLLAAPNMPKPYFAAYKVTDLQTYNFEASSGSLSSQEQEGQFAAQVMMRVGSDKEDNSFFKAFILNTAAVPYPSDSYDGLRSALWGLSDVSYKQALAQLAKKQAFKKSKNITENYDDFSSARTATEIEELPTRPVDKDFWVNLVKETSLQGKDLGLDEFTAYASITLKPSYFITSEGAKYLKDDTSIFIYFMAKAKTKDGFEIKEAKSFSYADLKDVPPVAELAQKAKEVAQRAKDLTEAEKAEPFIGPVLLEKTAAAILFDKAFKENIIRVRPVRSASDSNDSSMGEFAQKKGLKIMPADFDVIDDPLLKTFKNKTLSGYYKIDDEGVKASKLQLVKNGKLINLPTTRSLIKDQKTSNGHARIAAGDDKLFAQAYIGNLMFLPHKTVEEKELKTQFAKYCKEEGLDYCYIIRTNPLNGVFSAYKMDAVSGKETPVYGIDKNSFTTRTLRDIKFAGDDLEVYNFSSLREPAYSIIAPSVILSEMELKPSQKTGLRKPLVERPE